MVIDASALCAILLQEDDEASFRDAIAKAAPDARSISAIGVWEIDRRIRSEFGPPGSDLVDELLRVYAISIHAVTERQLGLARHAMALWSGRPVRLNLGDCSAYALARDLGQPLLFKGDDFSQTDIAPAIA